MSEEIDEFSTFLAEVFGASARAGAIVAAAQVEDALAEAIRSRMKELEPSEDRALFDGAAAPLSSFHAKIHVGFALGIYSSAFRQDLIAVKDVRNRFAHEIATRSFGDPQISKLCTNLHYPAHRATVEGVPEPTEAFTRFHSTVGALYFGLGLAASHLERPMLERRWGLLNYGHRPGSVPKAKKRAIRPSNRSSAAPTTDGNKGEPSASK